MNIPQTSINVQGIGGTGLLVGTGEMQQLIAIPPLLLSAASKRGDSGNGEARVGCAGCRSLQSS